MQDRKRNSNTGNKGFFFDNTQVTGYYISRLLVMSDNEDEPGPGKLDPH